MTALTQTATPFTAPEDWRRMLATMPEKSLLGMIEEKSRTMDMPWLTTMAECGLFGIAKSLETLQTHSEINALINTWSGRLQAATHFMTGITIDVTDTSPAYGKLHGQIALASFDAPEAMKTFYTAASLSIAADFNALMAHPLASQGSYLSGLQEPLAQWIGGAIALDLPEVVAQLGRDLPDAVTGFFPMASMGHLMASYATTDNDLDEHKKGGLELFVAPQALALLLSRDRCLEALWTHGATVHDTVFVREYGRDTDIEMGVADLCDFMRPTCLPDTWAMMLKKGFLTDNDDEASYDENDLKTMLDMAIKCMKSDTRPWLRNYIPALIDAGVYNTNPERSLIDACITGCITVVESFEGRLDWKSDALKKTMTKGGETEILVYSRTKETPFTAAANAYAKNPSLQYEHSEPCVLKLIEMGIAAGQRDLVFSLTNHIDVYGKLSGRVEPVFAFVDAKFHRGLVKFFENGLDPHANIGGSSSLMDYAIKHSPETAHMIRSFEARKKAMQAMIEIDVVHDAEVGGRRFAP